MIDKRPAAVIRAAGTADVMRAVNVAREHELLLSIRGGGHNIAGNAVCDGGLMVDLSPMKSVRINPSSRTARVEPGVTLAEFDKEAQAFGLATPLGINSTTGVAGLTLGGGFGWVSRKFGLTVDNLISADVVIAEGELVHASAKENADLFWAIRGGGGNFGVVTSFEFRLHPVGPEVLAGLIVHPFSNAKRDPAGYRGVVASAPDDLDLLGRDAQGAAAALPSAGGPRQGGPRARGVLRRAIRRRARARSRRSGRWASRSRMWSGRRPSSAGSRPSTRCSRRARATTGSPMTSSSSATRRSI